MSTFITDINELFLNGEDVTRNNIGDFYKSYSNDKTINLNVIKYLMGKLEVELDLNDDNSKFYLYLIFMYLCCLVNQYSFNNVLIFKNAGFFNVMLKKSKSYLENININIAKYSDIFIKTDLRNILIEMSNILEPYSIHNE